MTNNKKFTVEETAMMQAFEEHMESIEIKECALDFIDTYTNEEIAQMIREKVITIEEAEAGLRRRWVMTEKEVA